MVVSRSGDCSEWVRGPAEAPGVGVAGREARGDFSGRGYAESPTRRSGCGTVRHTPRRVSRGNREESPGTTSAQLARMPRPVSLAVRFTAAALLLLGAATGCGTSSQLAGGADAGNDAAGQGSGSTSDAAEGGSPLGDGGSGEASVIACVSADECVDKGSVMQLDPGWPTCCVDGVCAYGLGSLPIVCPDASTLLVRPSNYDHSCKTDSDCVAVPEGDPCVSGGVSCKTTAISMSAYAQYQSDVANNATSCGNDGPCPPDPAPAASGVGAPSGASPSWTLALTPRPTGVR